jgi:hypothetical protein
MSASGAQSVGGRGAAAFSPEAGAPVAEQGVILTVWSNQWRVYGVMGMRCISAPACVMALPDGEPRNACPASVPRPFCL